MNYKSIKVYIKTWEKLRVVAFEKRISMAQLVDELSKSLDNASK